jgi:hypothetical protein
MDWNENSKSESAMTATLACAACALIFAGFFSMNATAPSAAPTALVAKVEPVPALGGIEREKLVSLASR